MGNLYKCTAWTVLGFFLEGVWWQVVCGGRGRGGNRIFLPIGGLRWGFRFKYHMTVEWRGWWGMLQWREGVVKGRGREGWGNYKLTGSICVLPRESSHQPPDLKVLLFRDVRPRRVVRVLSSVWSLFCSSVYIIIPGGADNFKFYKWFF